MNEDPTKKPEAKAKGILDWPTMRVPGMMPGYGGLLAQQINQGFSSLPVQGLLGQFNQLYSPMDVYDTRPADIRNPPVPGQPAKPAPTAPAPVPGKQLTPEELSKLYHGISFDQSNR